MSESVQAVSDVEENLQYIPEHCIYCKSYNRNKYNTDTKFSSTVQAWLILSQNSYSIIKTVQTFDKLFHSTVRLFIDQSCIVFHFPKRMFFTKEEVILYHKCIILLYSTKI